MADLKKPAASTRKKTTKRGPTKAAALKALGLTQDDLDTLKKVAETRKRLEESKQMLDVPGKVENAKNALQRAVEREQAKKAEVETATAEETWYVRNLRHVEVSFRLERQIGPGKKRTELKPRGQRGDIKKLEPGDLTDGSLQTQVSYDVVEIINGVEAKRVIEGQSTNQQQAVHPAMAMLRNELGQPYEDGAVKVDPEFNSQGVVVAHLNPQGGGAGEIPGLGRAGIDWNAARTGPAQAAPGGNSAIISDGFARPDVAAQQDAVARQKGLEGPAAGLGGVKVTVGEVQKT
jgi:hypothetical protein